MNIQLKISKYRILKGGIIFFLVSICLIDPLSSERQVGSASVASAGTNTEPDIRIEPTALFFFRIAGISFLMGNNPDSSQRINFNPNAPAVPGEIIVKFRSGIFDDAQMDGSAQTSDTSINALLAQMRMRDIKRVFPTRQAPLCDIYRLRFPDSTNLSSLLGQIAGNPNVEWVEPNYLAFTSDLPNDYKPSQQWGIEKIQADRAWSICHGTPNIVIAIIDTGVDYDHPDLAGNIWHNTDEVSDNGIDDDGNGYVDDDIGWDFVSVTSGGAAGEDMGPRDRDPMDFHGHGTHCAGIASAVTDNGIGIAGVSWHCKIMSLRAGYRKSTGEGALAVSDTSAALYYAVKNNARVINMSWSGDDSNTLHTAIEYALSKDCVLMAAAGNDAKDSPTYPSAYPGVIAVSASDTDDNRASFSNYGLWVDIAAPGRSIYSTMYNDTYSSWSGTSMATPFVAGVAGLVLSQDPLLSAESVAQQLVNSADDVGWAKRLNAYKTLMSGRNIFTIYNDGTAPLDVTSIVPQNGSIWLKTDQTAITIPAGSSQVIVVSLDIAGLTVGNYAERLLVRSNDPDENPYPNGVNVSLEIGNNAPQITSLVASPNPVDEDEISTLTVVASDPDSHALSYNWHATGGWIEGSGNVVTYHPPIVFARTAYTISVSANDEYGGSNVASVDIIVNYKIPAIIKEIYLQSGWNLISIPLRLPDTTIDNVLESIDGQYESVWTYDSGWKKYLVNAPPSFSNLETIEHGKGYWINMTRPSVLKIKGKQIIDTAIQLNAGWNLVGYNGLTAKLIGIALLSITDHWLSVWTYDDVWKQYVRATSGGYGTLKILDPGKGYWINVKDNCVWDINMTSPPMAPPSGIFNSHHSLK